MERGKVRRTYDKLSAGYEKREEEKEEFATSIVERRRNVLKRRGAAMPEKC